jgi:hypothetical protein
MRRLESDVARKMRQIDQNQGFLAARSCDGVASVGFVAYDLVRNDRFQALVIANLRPEQAARGQDLYS